MHEKEGEERRGRRWPRSCSRRGLWAHAPIHHGNNLISCHSQSSKDFFHFGCFHCRPKRPQFPSVVEKDFSFFLRCQGFNLWDTKLPATSYIPTRVPLSLKHLHDWTAPRPGFHACSFNHPCRWERATFDPRHRPRKRKLFFF